MFNKSDRSFETSQEQRAWMDHLCWPEKFQFLARWTRWPYKISLFHLPVGQQSQRETLGTKLQKDWRVRRHLTVGERNIINEPLVDHRQIIFPPLHIKLGLMKQFVKALDTAGNCFKQAELIKILKLWKRDTKDDEISTWWQTIARVFNENALEKPILHDRSNKSLVQSKVTQNMTFSPKFLKLNNNLLFYHDFKLQVSFFSSILILYKGYAYIFGELLIVLVLILIFITYLESQYMAKNISAHCKKTWPDRKKLMPYLVSVTPNYHNIKQVSNPMQKTKFNIFINHPFLCPCFFFF